MDKPRGLIPDVSRRKEESTSLTGDKREALLKRGIIDDTVYRDYSHTLIENEKNFLHVRTK